MIRTSLLLALALVAAPVAGQSLKLSSESGVFAQTEGNVKFFTGSVFIPSDEPFVPVPAELIIVDSPSAASNINVRVFTDDLPVRLVARGQEGSIKYYVWTEPGEFLVDVVDFGVGDIQSLKIVVGDHPDPDPDPDPDPPPGEGPFDDLALRVGVWTIDASVNQEMSEVYAANAAEYRDAEHPDSTARGMTIMAEIVAIPGYTQSEYEQFFAGINADIRGRWHGPGLPQEEMADWWAEIAIGLEE